MDDGRTGGRSRPSRRGPARAAAAAFLAAAVAGCSDAATGPEGTQDHLRLEVIWGDGESGLAGERLLYPVIVLVTDVRARPVPGVPVRFEPAEGCGSAEPSLGVSDDEGRAMTRWRLGSGDVRRQQLQVTIDAGVEGGGAQIVLEAIALRPDEADRIEVSGALGPLKGIVLVPVEDGTFSVLFEKATADTTILLPPLPQGEMDVVVFSRGNRPLMERVNWTVAVDTARVTLRPPVLVDVNVSVQAGVFEEMLPLIEADLHRMEELWMRDAMGLRLGRVSWVDGTGGPGWDVRGSGLCAALTPGAAIELSVVGTVDGYQDAGYGCVSGHVFLGKQWYRYPYLLAHEVGHTFALLHAAYGLMNPGNPGGYVRTGEVFRAHFNLRSALNTIFRAQPEAQRRLCAGGAASPCLPDDFEFSETAAVSAETTPSSSGRSPGGVGDHPMGR